MKAARVTLVASGVAIAGVGIALLLGTLRFEQLVGLAIWLACSVVLHDGVLVPVVTVMAAVLKRAGRALPRPAILLIEGGFALGMLISLAVGPEIYAKALGPRNETVLPADYATRLIAVWAAILVLTAAAVTLVAVITGARTRRMNDRRSSTHV
jgi:hypothetical protein